MSDLVRREELYLYAIDELGIANDDVDDYRAASNIYMPELEEIPNAIIIWLKSGDKIIYMKEYDECRECHTKWDHNKETEEYKYCPFCGAKMEAEQ